MGCGPSLQSRDRNRAVGISANTKIINKLCPMVRLDCSKTSDTFHIEGNNYNFNIRYCYVSQRGYYPNAMNKANQDSYLICESILEDDSCHLFGVFDGHGEAGDYCSHFAADNLPNILVKEMKAYGQPSSIPDDVLSELYSKSFINTNTAMHNSGVDDILSGTTGITVLVKGDKLFVANVGDSRAIIASEVNDMLKYSALSNDQTPYRKDERERVKSQGGKIMNLDQIEGNEPIHENWGTNLGDEIDEIGDPPRVWDSTLERPGCAFTRSLGDHIAKGCGVCAQPEILVWNITPKDRFAVIASDGIFEFITSQTVVQMVAKYRDPVAAAKHVVAEAYRLWLTFDERTDDITIIIIYFDDIIADTTKKNLSLQPSLIGGEKQLSRGASLKVAPDGNGSSGVIFTLSAEDNPSDLQIESRPVRTVMSKARRKEISELLEDEKEDFDFSKVIDTKTPADIQRITEMLRNNFMFANLSGIQREQIFKVMTLKSVKANEVIIEEGAKGNEMYVVDSGEFTVLKKDENGVNQVVFVYTAEGSAFGELSLMYGKPRAASVVAKTDGRIWSIARTPFKAVIMRGRHEGLLKVIQTVPALNNLSYCQLHRLCMSSAELSYSTGEIILNGFDTTPEECTWALGVIMSGSVRMLPIHKDANEDGNERGKIQRRGSAVFSLKNDESIDSSPHKPVGVHQHKKKQVRSNSTYLVSVELGLTFLEACADDPKTKIVFISKTALVEIAGKEVEQLLYEEAIAAKMKGKRREFTQLEFEEPGNIFLPKLTSLQYSSILQPIALIGDFGFVGSCNQGGGKRSVKVLWKDKTCSNRKEETLLRERNLLAAASTRATKGGAPSLLPYVESSFQNDKTAYLIFTDLFVCDLSLALQSQCIQESAMPYIVACLLSGLSAIHGFGVIHRFINSGTIYITSKGVPKIADFRFSKAMEGCKNYTICGDPLFFAPEIVNQNGYDYAADLWALGVLIYEIYEGSTPFGTSEMEETAIFKTIAGFKGTVKYSKATAAAQELINSLLRVSSEDRCGYRQWDAFKGRALFTGIDWNKLNTSSTISADIQPSIDVSQLGDQDLRSVVSAVFDQY